MSDPPTEPTDVATIDHLYEVYSQLRVELAGTIVGLDEAIEQIVIALLCRSHCILEGVPGLAKTLLVSTLASLFDLSFRRVQFTPDLMPGDITGADVLEEDHTTGGRVFRFVEGPLFGNVVLADEINRTPPKTQSALLEAMEERQVTSGGRSFKLPSPFMVLATQNPIEQEGTYPLPEAQLDRFMLKIKLGYPTDDEELEIVRRATTRYTPRRSTLLTGEEILTMQNAVREIPVGDHVYRYTVRLVRLTRASEPGAIDYVQAMTAWGAGPRASIALLLAAKARAILQGRYHASTEDVAAMARPVLRHRIVPTFNAEAAGVDSDTIIDALVGYVDNGVEPEVTDWDA
ncbi:MoxR family ATPase [soil metagenome]